jgi:hypothetical protein
MDATLYTGNGSTLTVTNAGGFSPNLVWMKRRSSISNHYLQDTNRGALNSIFSDSTSAEVNQAGTLTSFNSNGFSLGTDAGVNGSGSTFVGWQWKAGGTAVTNTSGSISSQVSAGATQGFSVVTYTGTGVAGATIGHGLGVAPSMIIPKSRTGTAPTNSWHCYHASLGATKGIILNSTAGETIDSGFWNNTAPTSSVITLGTYNSYSSQNYVAYCFAQIAGFSAFGSYTGNGSADGPFVYTGFRPRWLMIKRTDATQNWAIVDTARDTFNVSNKRLFPNLSSAEDTGIPNFVDLLSNGFKFRDSNVSCNASGGTYIYMAFCENPFALSNAF